MFLTKCRKFYLKYDFLWKLFGININNAYFCGNNLRMENVEQELGFWDWVAKVNERLTFLRLNVMDHRDVSETDYDLLKALFKIHHNGEFPLYKTATDIPVQTVSQINLFSDITSDTALPIVGGTVIEYLPVEPKIE